MNAVLGKLEGKGRVGCEGVEWRKTPPPPLSLLILIIKTNGGALYSRFKEGTRETSSALHGSSITIARTHNASDKEEKKQRTDRNRYQMSR